jgi:hypothetical protein
LLVKLEFLISCEELVMGMIYLKILVIVVLFLQGCEYLEFSKGVSAESIQRFESHKKFVNAICFEGVIASKDSCLSNNWNQFRLNINTIDFNADTVNIGYRTFEPFYAMQGHRISISVNRYVFDSAIVGSKCSKVAKSNVLMLINQPFVILSYKEGEWFD